MSHAAPEAGWYPDPDDPSVLRWWDGADWTEHRLDDDDLESWEEESSDGEGASEGDATVTSIAAGRGFGDVEASTSFKRDIELAEGEQLLDPKDVEKDDEPRVWPWELRPAKPILKAHRLLYAMLMLGGAGGAYSYLSTMTGKLLSMSLALIVFPMAGAGIVLIADAIDFEDPVRRVRERRSQPRAPGQGQGKGKGKGAAPRRPPGSRPARRRVRYIEIEVTRPIPPSPLIMCLVLFAMAFFAFGSPHLRPLAGGFVVLVAAASLFRFAVWKPRGERSYVMQLVVVLVLAAAGTVYFGLQRVAAAERFHVDPRIALWRLEVDLHRCAGPHNQNFTKCSIGTLVVNDAPIERFVRQPNPYVLRYEVAADGFTIAARDPRRPESSVYTLEYHGGDYERTCAPLNRLCPAGIW